MHLQNHTNGKSNRLVTLLVSEILVETIALLDIGGIPQRAGFVRLVSLYFLVVKEATHIVLCLRDEF